MRAVRQTEKQEQTAIALHYLRNYSDSSAPFELTEEQLTALAANDHLCYCINELLAIDLAYVLHVPPTNPVSIRYSQLSLAIANSL